MIEKDLSLVCPPADNSTLNNFTMGPNWIYDTLLIKESLSVIKVVTYINRNTTGRTGRDGKRVEVVQASYEWIARKMEMSVRAVGTAMRQAIAQGYIIQVKAGRLAEKDKPAEGGWYALNWNWSTASQNDYVKLDAVKAALAETIVTEDSANMPEAEQSLQGRTEQVLQDVKTRAEQSLQGRARQILPVVELKAEQILPPYNNKVSKINNHVEIKARVSDTLRPVNSTENKNEQANSEQENSKRKGSTAIGRLVTDFTREFGDSDSLALPNISRALNLWRKSGLDEQEFIRLVYQARQKTKLSGSVQHRRMAVNGSASDLPNRMPYFFAVLSELVHSPQRTQSFEFRVPSSEFRVEPKGKPVEQSVQLEMEDSVSLDESSQEVGLVEVAQEREVLEVKEGGPDNSAVWQKVVAELGWISESKRDALARVELSPVEQNSRTRARFELKFARQWHKGLFEQWDLERLALALGAELGLSLNGDMLLLS